MHARVSGESGSVSIMAALRAVGSRPGPGGVGRKKEKGIQLREEETKKSL